jgi:hypothetical protein
MAVKHKVLTKNGIEEKSLTPIKAIRAKCMECSNWQYSEVARCEIMDCALWMYRFGKNPDRKGIGNTV